MKSELKRRIASCVFTLAVMFVAAGGLATSDVYADSVSYVERSWNGSEVVSVTKTADCTPMWNCGKDIGSGWYYVNTNMEFGSSDRLNISGTVNLVLINGYTLKCKDGINVPAGSTLNIYAQEGDSGELIALGDTDYCAAIGGNDGQDGGTVNIHGGKITADAKNDGAGLEAAGIGGGEEGGGGNVTIYGGTVSAIGTNYAAGIGAGDVDDGGKDGGTVKIYGGTVTAQGGCDAAGIGGGEGASGGDVEIWGGMVTATGGTNNASDSGAGIGSGDIDGNSVEAGTVKIHGGTVTAQGGPDAAGIGGGNEVSGGTIVIDGGTVNATGGVWGAGIGGGEKGDPGSVTIRGTNTEVTATGGKWGAGIGGGNKGSGNSIVIEDGKVTATGGEGGAGIGAGDGGSASSGDITIKGGEVTATGGDEAAGIGGGDEGSSSNAGVITISGGTVTATGGTKYGAGIGGGERQEGGTINITGGDITASGGECAAGIGGGDRFGAGNINISGGKIKATGGESGGTWGGAGIGSAFNELSNPGTITINDGEVDATGGARAAGIGGGYNASACTITINDGTIRAQGGTRGGAGIGTGGFGEWKEDTGLTINGGDITAIGGNAAQDNNYKYYTGAAIGCGGMHADNYESFDSRFFGSIELNGGTIHASYDGENSYGVVLIGHNKYYNTSTINIKAKCRIFVDKGSNNSGKTMSPMQAATVNLRNVTEGSTVYSSKVFNMENTIEIAPAADRKTWCTAKNDNKSIAILPCDHEEGEYRAIDDNKHRIACTHCTASISGQDEDHAWGEAAYTWEDDNSEVTAKHTCKKCGREVSETADAMSEVTKAATCTEKGETTYTSAAFENEAFTVQTKTVEDVDALGHDWGEPTYEWAKDNKSVTATRVCKHDENHKETETAETTSDVTKAATCTEKGETTYTSEAFENEAFKVQTKIVGNINPIGHDWGAWTKLDDKQHQRICKHDKKHVEKGNHSWDGGKVTKAATTTAEGKKEYTCKVCGAKKTEVIPKLKPAPTPKPTPSPTPAPKPTPTPAKKAGGTLIARMTAKGNTGMNISWNKVNGASGYDIFLAQCNHGGRKYTCKRVKTVKGNKTFKWTKTGLKKGVSYKGYVKAYVTKNGKKTYVSTSPYVHAYGGSGTKKYTNAKSLTVNRSNVTLKKGKTFKITSKIGKVQNKKALMPKSHVSTLRYKTAAAKIATVSNSGKITAKGKGTCYVYVFTHNGVSARIKVTVK